MPDTVQIIRSSYDYKRTYITNTYHVSYSDNFDNFKRTNREQVSIMNSRIALESETLIKVPN